MTVRVPGNSHRTMILGRTGTGKSQAALDMLSEQDFDTIPWVIIDYKGEDLIADIRAAVKGEIREISVDKNPPKAPGLYYMTCRPIVDDDAMEAWLRKVHRQGNCGLFIDEGYAMPKYGSGPGFTMILTQGRTLNIPVICLYQRPVWMSRFAIAQADFIRVFKQGDERDEKVTKNFCRPAILPNGSKLGPMELDLLPDYYSLWHDVGRGLTSILKPASDRQTVINNFKDRLQPKRKGMFI
jgi:hypothetical protein